MSFDRIIGQPFAVELCQRWLAKETTHPLIFFGPEGVGKRLTALELAKALNCLKTPGRQGCNPEAECNSCHKISTGQHADVRVIDFAFQAAQRNEPIEKQQTLKIETILEERRRLLQSALEGHWKVMIIDDAHRLTPDAANVLLKTLEEPPARTAMILITPFRDRLFSTILSRCQPVRFRQLTDEEMQQALSRAGVPEDAQMRLLELALGSPGKALHMNRKEQIESLIEAEDLWRELPQQGPLGVIQKFEGRARGSRVARADVEAKVHSLMLPAARALRSGDLQAARAIGLLQVALQHLRQNAPPALVYDDLLIQLSRPRKG